MSFPGIGFALMVGVAIGTAIYMFFNTNEQGQRQHRYVRSDSPPHTEYEPNYDTNTRKRNNATNTNQCSICLETLRTSVLSLSCGHLYHENCITMWLRTNSTCPICREFVR